jgi:tetratricopeptide (TPR) repeat protein
LGQWADCIADLQQANKTQLGDPAIWHELALAHRGKGDIQAAQALHRQMVAHFAKTTNPSTANDVAYQAALFPDCGGDLPTVVRLAELAHRGEPDNALYLDTLGVVLHRAGRYAEAVVHLNQAVTLQGQDVGVESLLFLSMAHRRLSRHMTGPSLVGLMATPTGPHLLAALPTLVHGSVEATHYRAKAEEGMKKHKEPNWQERLIYAALRREPEAGL